MWESELIARQQTLMAKGPTQVGHLSVYSGGKVGESLYVKPKGVFDRLLSFFSPAKKAKVELTLPQ